VQEQDEPTALPKPLKKLVISDKVNRAQRTTKGNKASVRPILDFGIVELNAEPCACSSIQL
jgi:hypothetical protein